MWLHESESNSIITEAYENKIFPTIIYISNNSHPLIILIGLSDSTFKESEVSSSTSVLLLRDLSGSHIVIHQPSELPVRPPRKSLPWLIKHHSTLTNTTFTNKL